MVCHFLNVFYLVVSHVQGDFNVGSHVVAWISPSRPHAFNLDFFTAISIVSTRWKTGASLSVARHLKTGTHQRLCDVLFFVNIAMIAEVNDDRKEI
jgi:hypothetical protein